MRGPRSARAAAAILAAAAGLVAADRLVPAEPPRTVAPAAAETRPLSSATLVCPDVAESPDGSRSTTITLATEGTTGSVRAHAVRGGGGDVTLSPSAARQRLPVQTHSFGGTVLTASGDAAAGFSAELTSRYDAGATAGSASLPCLTPTADAYFVGPGTGAGRDPRLVLINPDPTPANVDVSVARNETPFSTDNTQGIALRGYESATIELVGVAADQAGLAVHVQTRSGRVTAAVRDRWSSGALPLGIDWLAASAPPATDLVMPGVGGAGTEVTLVVASQSADAGTAVVHAVTTTGEFTPAGLEAIDVPAGGIVLVKVPKSAFGSAGSLHVTSDVPLIGSAVTSRAGTSATADPDFAWTPAAAPLQGPAFAPPGTQLTLTAATDTSVQLSPGAIPAAAGAAPTTVLPANTTVTIALDAYPDGVLVVPASPGSVYAAVITAPSGAGGGLTARLLTTPRRTVVLLPARPDIFLGTGTTGTG
ncbi:MAG: hypothetical protein JWM93_2951 [Frankiales bacterium]|nr:hypothetical protein [Frankiales bacterium]